MLLEQGPSTPVARRDTSSRQTAYLLLMKAYLKLQHGPRPLGTLHLELYDETVPKTVQNFVALLQRNGGYRGSCFHRIIPGFMAQGGDYVRGDGTGSDSIYGPQFDDENFRLSHDTAGVLSMANSGPNTNGCQFFCCFRATPHLDHKHVVFGRVDLTQSAETLQALERVRTDAKDRPLQAVTIVDCGVLGQEEKEDKPTDAVAEAVQDDDEIDLEEDEDEPNPAEEEDEEEESVPKTKAEAMKLRLRKLKQKMNQARQLNKQAVKEEGERLTKSDKERRRQTAIGKQLKEEAWKAANAKALQTAKAASVDPKALTEQAADSVRAARAKSERDELKRFSIKDVHNPEGQHRNYQRNLKSVPRQHNNDYDDNEAASTSSTFNPLEAQLDNDDPARQREGARRVAAELHRRIAKSQKNDRKRKQKEIAAEQEQGTDVAHINQRNKRFNEKINRTYDKQTAEIRHNLERGTAL